MKLSRVPSPVRAVTRLAREVCVVLAVLSGLAGVALAGAPVQGTVVDHPGAIESLSPLPRSLSPEIPLQTAATVWPSYSWPLDRLLHDGVVLANYADDQPFNNVDFMGGNHAYAGHQGTDMALYNFRWADRGVRVLAASPGTVSNVEFNHVDRNTTLPAPDGGNWVFINGGGGSEEVYYHLRKNSPAVQVGEKVERGQTLGMVASSGNSTIPHLHFGSGDFASGPYQVRDPFHGTVNTLPSLWNSQPAYVGNAPLRFYDMGVFNKVTAGGNIFYVDFSAFEEGLTQPDTLGTTTPADTFLAVYFQYQGNAGDAYSIELESPRGLWSSYGPIVLTSKAQWDWIYWLWYFGPSVDPLDYGQWKARARINGVVAIEKSFRVGPRAGYPLRFRAPSGKSFRINGSTQRDTLRVQPLGGSGASFSLLGAPTGVSLSDSVVVIGPTSGQPRRSAFFQAIATRTGGGSRDTMWYHLVDFSKPLEIAVVAVGDAPPTGPTLSPAAPNPFHATTRLRFALPRSGQARLEILDLSGRRVRVLSQGSLDAGAHEGTWDGTDGHGRALPQGVYFCRLHTSEGTRTQRVLLLH